MRVGVAALLLTGLMAASLPDARAQAQTVAPAEIRLAQAISPDTPPPRRRPPIRVRVYPHDQPDDVYPRYDPGPNAVRECNAFYVREFRPSGTVIVPRMSCHWRRG